MWETYEFGTSRKGKTVEGDTTVPPTSWWNRWWLMWRVWNTVAVFEVKTDDAFRIGYRVGKKAYITTQLLNTSAKHGHVAESEMVNDDHRIPVREPSSHRLPAKRWPHICLLVGFEDCTVFALDKNGNEVPLTLIRRAPREDITFSDGHRLY